MISEVRLAARSGGGAPSRTCIGCRERDLRTVLLRLVVDRGDEPRDVSRLVVDRARSMPGRGAWLHPQVHCLELAARRRAFARALRLDRPVDLTAVHEAVNQDTAGEHPGRRLRVANTESGLEADGHPMSTQR